MVYFLMSSIGDQLGFFGVGEGQEGINFCELMDLNIYLIY